MGDVFELDEDQLSEAIDKKLNLDDPVDDSEENVTKFKKFRSDSTVSVGSIRKRLGTSYEVKLDEFYESESRSNSTNPAVSMPKTGKPVIQDFDYLRVLGKGSYGKVVLVRHRQSGKLYAQKQLQKASMVVNAGNYERTLTERTILKKVRHPNIVKLYYALQDFDKVYLILEYLQGGELFHHLREERILSEKVACYYIAEMSLALHHLHTNAGVIYRDLKPENCMLNDKGHLVLTDFGLSKESLESRSLWGTAEYVAPEVIHGDSYDTQCDWWSLGAVTFDILTGAPPFTGPSNQRIMDKILKKKVNYPYYLSQDAKSFLQRLLNKNPAKRINVDKEFDKFKTHRFFRYINWDDLIAQNDDKLPPPIVPVISDPQLAENFDDEFTDMKITPPSSPIRQSMWQTIDESRSGSTSSYIPISRQDSGDLKESVYFTGFSYTNETLLH